MMGLSREQRLQRIQNIFSRAVNGSALVRDAFAASPVTVGTVSDGALTLQLLASNSVLQPITNQMAWYGGVPTGVNGLYVAMPVTSVLPSLLGNIGSGFLDKNSWVGGYEFETNAPKLQLGFYCDNVRKLFVFIDDQLADKAGHTGPGATQDILLTLDLSYSTRSKRVRVIWPTHTGTGPVLPKTVRYTAGYSIWKPDQNEVLKAGFFADSYGEGVNANNSVTHTAIGPFPIQLAERLGIRDMRQFVVGSTGFISDNAGTRKKAIDQLDNYAAQFPIDMAFVNYGINDSSNTPPVIEEAVYRYLLKLKAMTGGVPIFVYGCQAGNGAPSAAQIATELAIQRAVRNLRFKDCQFIPVSTDTPTWFNSVNATWAVDPTDNLHGTMAGQEYIGMRGANGARKALAAMLAVN